MFGCQILNMEEFSWGGGRCPSNGKQDRSLEESPELWGWGAGLLSRKGDGLRLLQRTQNPQQSCSVVLDLSKEGCVFQKVLLWPWAAWG